MVFRKFAGIQPATPGFSTPKNHEPAAQEVQRVFSSANQVLNLQRKIGNRATTHVMSRRNSAPAQSGNSGTIQRLPSGDEIKKRSDSGSNAKGILSKGFRQGVSQYDTVIILVDQYNEMTKKSKVEGGEAARKKSVAFFEQHLDKVWKEASEYIGKHEADEKRAKTIASFRLLAEEIVKERIDLTKIAGNTEDYDQPAGNENKVTWHQAIGMTTRSNATRHANVMKIMNSLGLPVDFVATLDSTALDNLIAADKALSEGDIQVAEFIFGQLENAIPVMWPLIKSAMMRKHLDKVDPKLAAALSSGFEHKDPNAEKAFGKQQDLYAGGFSSALEKYQGAKNLGANEEAIKKEAGMKIMPDGLNLEQKYLPGWEKGFKQRMEWERKNVNLNDFKSLKKHEQHGLAAYAGLSDPYNKALRSNVGGMNQDLHSQILSMISALNKLPPYEGLVYRHDSIFSGFSEANQVGASTTDMAFVSTTKDANTLKKIKGSPDPEVLIVIQSKTGRFIKPISRFNNFADGDENEVLFKPGVRFRITKRYDAKDGKPGPDNFPKDMDPELKSALDQNREKGRIKIVLKKLEE